MGPPVPGEPDEGSEERGRSKRHDTAPLEKGKPIARAERTESDAELNGEVWFTQSVADDVGRITADGVYGETRSIKGSVPFGITLGHDGTSAWYAMTDADRIGLLVPT